MNRRSFVSPVGPISIAEDGGRIVRVDFGAAEDGRASVPILLEAEKQLRAYFAGRLKKFDLPLDMRGTEFQRRVWSALRKSPYGETRSYGDIAAMAGNPKACRAVGMANNRNPVSIIVPCHRVVGHDGSLVGYGGGLKAKKFLLELERKSISF
ncbi:MAG: methylated-DNA--[protein]-cysteine S-methyltransferase [Rickettsiales bacterium]|jgi:methylated-DNA-[protein]-cysteine S-methyltransferase|nr:methylated-DNA--[protein]-cysteine S-methyltransferase [Rickettsiales bacterium]